MPSGPAPREFAVGAGNDAAAGIDSGWAGRNPGEKDTLVLRHRPAAHGRPVNLLGFVEETKDGRRVATDKPRTYEVQYMGGAGGLAEGREVSSRKCPGPSKSSIRSRIWASTLTRSLPTVKRA